MTIETLLKEYTTQSGPAPEYLVHALDANGGKSKFFTSNEEFSAVVKFALENVRISHRELALEYEIADSTVGRWATGIARPHPLVQRLIRETIYDMAKLR